MVGGLADDIAVMYAGHIVEYGPAEQVLGDARHPYTRALLDAVPVTHTKGTPLAPSAVRYPRPGPSGCPYADRCPRADDRCREQLPARTLPPGAGRQHDVLCWHPFEAPSADSVTASAAAVGTGTNTFGAAVGAAVVTPRPAEPVTAPGVEAASGARAPAAATGALLLEVEGISMRFRSPDGIWHDAVRDVSFRLHAAETLGVVGESGSGKTTAARIVLGQLEPDTGTVTFAGEPWSGLRERARRSRRRRIQAIYQDPLGSFDPRYRVERIIGEAVAIAGVRRGAARRARVVELLDQVGLPEGVLHRRPLELSGGQRQRVAIARALAPAPDLIVCDEPVSALDVSIQAQILDLLAGLQRDLGVALLFISHDLGVIHHVSDRIIVMKDGHVVETGDVATVFAHPSHTYTRDLLAAVPRPVGGRAAPGVPSSAPPAPGAPSAPNTLSVMMK